MGLPSLLNLLGFQLDLYSFFTLWSCNEIQVLNYWYDVNEFEMTFWTKEVLSLILHKPNGSDCFLLLYLDNKTHRSQYVNNLIIKDLLSNIQNLFTF